VEVNMMIPILALAAAVSGGVVASGAGAAILVGFVFFLIGFSGKKGRRPNFLTSDGLKAIGTLLVVAVFMVLAYFCTLTSGSLIRFNGMDPVFQYEQGKKLLFIGMASAAWFVASFLWLLPYIVEIKPREWNRNHLIGVGVYFALVFAAAGAAML
jgi:glucan phosphoethanolaminetransferase (alkaline phosphatase superfamily)